MSLALSKPVGPSWRPSELRIAFWYADGGWDFAWSKSDLGYRMRVESIELGSNERVGRARLVVNPAGETDGETVLLDELDMRAFSEIVDPGQRICIYAENGPDDEYNGGFSRSFLFDGYLPAPELKITDRAQVYTLLASTLFEQTDAHLAAWIDGAHYGLDDADGNPTWRYIPGLPAVFNFQGRPNRSADLVDVEINGTTYENVPTFTDPGRATAKYWKLADVLKYLLVFHFIPAADYMGLGLGNGLSRIEDVVAANGDPQALSNPNTATFQDVIATACPELSVHGMTVRKAIMAWCATGEFRVGQFSLNDGTGQPNTVVGFWMRGEGGPFTVLGGPRSERTLRTVDTLAAAGARTMFLPADQSDVDPGNLPEIAAAGLVFDAAHVVTGCTRFGDVVRYEVTVGRACATDALDILKPGWVPDTMFGDNLSGEALTAKIAEIKRAVKSTASGDAGTMFGRYDRRGANHQTYPITGRLWILNESGEWSGTTYGRTNGETTCWAAAAYTAGYDFHAHCQVPRATDPWTGDTYDWVPRRRAILELISTFGGQKQKPLLECSFDSGAHWYPYPGNHSFIGRDDTTEAQIAVVLTDQNLATLKNENPSTGDTTKNRSIWEAIVRGTFRLALTCAVEADEAVYGHAAQGGGWGNYTRHIDQFAPAGKLRKQLMGNSTLIGKSGWDNTEVDDSAAAAAQANAFLRAHQARLISGSLIIPWVSNDWLPGDLVSGIEPRSVSFKTIKGDVERFPEIIRTLIRQAEGGHATQLYLDDERFGGGVV